MHYVDYTSCCLYRVDPPADEQQACSNHVQAYYWNKLIENSASCSFILYGVLQNYFWEQLKFELYIMQISGFTGQYEPKTELA